ncbi:MAG: ImmA/IrrE family metallo-endopeptidase [Pseudonocardia sp.]|nr:ImmA/IrrE family metallo-endopeptidase [Pseudonocardia sp.]
MLDQHGEITIRHADLDQGLMGLTTYRDNTVDLASDLTAAEWRSTLAHELVHLTRGPVPRALAAVEEVAVQRVTAELLIPPAAALAQLDRSWSDQEIQTLAARYAVDRDVIETVLDPPALPFPPPPRSEP